MKPNAQPPSGICISSHHFHRDLVVGVASYALEFLRTVARLDTVYVSVGMGSGICGLITARDLLGLNTEIVGVGAINAPATARSFARRASRRRRVRTHLRGRHRDA